MWQADSDSETHDSRRNGLYQVDGLAVLLMAVMMPIQTIVFIARVTSLYSVAILNRL